MTMRAARAVLGIAGVMTFCGAVAAWAGADDAKPVYEKKCKVCHSIGADRGKMADTGGPVDGVGTKRDEAWLRGYLKDPKSKMPNAKMPKVALSDKEFDDMIAYMLTLK